METGKTTKYFKYAIGEIVLVVIGILIALSINNWNTVNKENSELNDYLLKISENVTEDLVIAQTNLKRREDVQNLSQNIIKFIYNKQLDSLEITNVIQVFVDFQFTPRRGGYQSLTNSGYIGKLKRSKVDSLLFQYYFNVDDLMREETSFNGFIESLEASVNSNVPFMPFAQNFYGYAVDSKVYSRNTEKYFNSTALQNAVIRSSGQAQIFRKYHSLIETGKLLNQEINLFIKRND